MFCLRDTVKKRFKIGTAFIIVLALLMTGLVGCGEVVHDYSNPADAYDRYIASLPTDLNMSFAEMYSAIGEGPLGFSLAGNASCDRAAELIRSEMEQVGLSSVTVESFETTSYAFRSATLTRTVADGSEKTYTLCAYPGDKPVRRSFELVYAGAGTTEEYSEIASADKMALVIIPGDDRDALKYVAREAAENGVAALLVCFAPVEGENTATNAIFSGDFSSVIGMPVLSVSYDDAVELSAVCVEAEDSESVVIVSLSGEFYLTPSKTASNIVGMIPGIDTSSAIIVTADYDRLFYGYNENVCSVSLMLGMAKSIISSGYKPTKNIYFVAYSGSEFSKRGAVFGTSGGAYWQLTHDRSEWSDMNCVHIDITMPAALHGDDYPIAASTGLEQFVSQTLGGLEGAGGQKVSVSTYTSDGGSGSVFESRGIPTIGLDVSASKFASLYRHTQFDNATEYNADSMRFSYQIYGKLLFELDACAVTPFDFFDFFNSLATADYTGLDTFGGLELKTAAYEASSCANKLLYCVRTANSAFKEAVIDGNDRLAARIYSESSYLSNAVRQSFARIERVFFCIDDTGAESLEWQRYASQLASVKSALDFIGQDRLGSASGELTELSELRHALTYRSVGSVYSLQINHGTEDELLWTRGRLPEFSDIQPEIQVLYDNRLGNFEVLDVSVETARVQELCDYLEVELASSISACVTGCRLFKTVAEGCASQQ